MDASGLRADSAETLELLDRVVAGDARAINALLARHRHEMRRFVDLHLDRLLRAKVDPSDVVQEAHVEMTQRLPEYLRRRHMPFHVWARLTVHKRLNNERRKYRALRRDVRREKVPDQSSFILAEAIRSPGASPSSNVRAKELAEQVATVVAALDDDDREILLLRHVDDMPYAEIALLLDIEPATARKRYGRALIRLERRLKASGLTRTPS